MRNAVKIFANHGFGGASVSEIAAACSVSKSILYHYFNSKEDILYAAMQAHMEVLSATTDLSAYRGIDPSGWFQHLALNLLEHYAGAADSQKVLLNELDFLAPDQRANIVRQQRRLVDFAQQCLVEAVSPLRPERTQVRAHVMLFFGMINWSHSWFDPDRGVSRTDLARQAANAAVTGLRSWTTSRA
ncbi:MAG: TetR/AcrR family transcriptional regulator [Myxococcota bacterium]